MKPMYYPEPFAFRPQRWLLKDQHKDGVSPEQLRLAQSAYCPFSVGRSSCVGKNLAYQGIMTIIARLVWLFNIRLQPGSRVGEAHPNLVKDRSREDEFQLYDLFVATHAGLMVEFRPRQ